MRKPRPIVCSLDEVIVTGEEIYAHVKYQDPDFGETRLEIGPEVAEMTNQDIVNLYNDVLKAEAELVGKDKYVAVETPLGSPQIKYHRSCQRWPPGGHVLRCLGDAH